METKTYYGYINSDEKVKHSASGGLATAMAEQIVQSGNVVYGVVYADDFRSAEYRRVSDGKGIEVLKGSKYIKAPLKKHILEAIARDLNVFDTVLFIGLPCDVNIVKSYMRKHNVNDSSLVCIDLICHGPTPTKVAVEYINTLEKRNKSKIIKFSVRYKNPFWTPPHLFAEFENGKKYIKPFYSTDYGISFMMMSNPECYKCRFKGDNYKSDITIGDFWGATKGDEGYNQYGTSVAFVHTGKGDEFIKSLAAFKLYSTNMEKALVRNQRYLYPTEKNVKKDAFAANFEKNGLKYAVRKNLGIKTLIKRRIGRGIKAVAKRLKG